jgi:hypothetical protein
VTERELCDIRTGALPRRNVDIGPSGAMAEEPGNIPVVPLSKLFHIFDGHRAHSSLLSLGTHSFAIPNQIRLEFTSLSATGLSWLHIIISLSLLPYPTIHLILPLILSYPSLISTLCIHNTIIYISSILESIFIQSEYFLIR